MDSLTCSHAGRGVIDQIFRKELLARDEGNKLPDTVTELVGDGKDTFLDFASGMLQWLPEKRKTANELLQHPFFDPLYRDRDRDIEARRSRRAQEKPMVV